MNHPLAALIREVGFYRIAGSDGCLCAHLAAHGIEVHVACYKGSAIPTDYYPSVTVRVLSHRELNDPGEAAAVALAVKDSVQAAHEGVEVCISYADYPSKEIAEKYPALAPDNY